MEIDKRNKILKQIVSIGILIILIILLVQISNITGTDFEYIVDESKLQIIYFDQTTTNMIQGLKGIFARKPLISIGI